MNREINLTKRVELAQGWRYCPVVLSANGRVKPDVVLIEGKEERHAEVNKVMEQVVKTMEAQGATVVPFTLPEYDKLAPALATSQWEARSASASHLRAT